MAISSESRVKAIITLCFQPYKESSRAIGDSSDPATSERGGIELVPPEKVRRVKMIRGWEPRLRSWPPSSLKRPALLKSGRWRLLSSQTVHPYVPAVNAFSLAEVA